MSDIDEAVRLAREVTQLCCDTYHAARDREVLARAVIALHEENERLRKQRDEARAGCGADRMAEVLRAAGHDCSMNLIDGVKAVIAERDEAWAKRATWFHERQSEASHKETEQRTAEAIAAWLESSPTCPCFACESVAPSANRAHIKGAIADKVRSGAWRKP